MEECCSGKRRELEKLAQQKEQRRVLMIVLIINAVMFIAEFGAGWVAHSTALMSDSLDMFGDALVYGLSLFAICRGARWEAGAGLVKGLIILAFGLGVVGEAIHKLTHGTTPSSQIMLVFGALALVANLTCLALLWRFRKLNINMSSTFECSRNDVVSNVGVLIAAVLVAWLGNGWPDLIIGAIMAVIFFRSAFVVLSEAWPAWRQGKDA